MVLNRSIDKNGLVIKYNYLTIFLCHHFQSHMNTERSMQHETCFNKMLELNGIQNLKVQRGESQNL